ncbi:DNA-binding protein [Mesorhizobium sp. BR1-1-9]|nr:DNA-binding protein [Mesorhizobium sp. BR1-1-9]
MDLVWGCDEIAKAIKRTKRQTFYMLESGALKARKVGNRWVADRQTLLTDLLN